MRLTFIGKDLESNPTGSPTVYRSSFEAVWKLSIPHREYEPI